MKTEPARSVEEIIVDMEHDVCSVGAWARVLAIMAGSDTTIDGSALHIVADALAKCGARIKSDWTDVHRLSR